MIILVIDATVEPGKRDAFLTAARTQAEASRKEEGCFAFDILVDPFDETAVRFYEVWRSMDDLALHRDRPHSAHFRETGRPLAASFTAKKYEAKELP
jgi:quinol monooxygenase YgiN